MFDIGWQELFIIAVVVIIVVGPKDLPKVLRAVGMWTGKARAMVREFQGHVDDMVRESELEEFKKEIEKAAEEPLGQAYEHIVGDDGAMADAFDFGGEEFGDGEKKRGGDDVKPEAAPELPSDSGAGGREPGTPAAAASKD